MGVALPSALVATRSRAIRSETGQLWSVNPLRIALQRVSHFSCVIFDYCGKLLLACCTGQLQDVPLHGTSGHISVRL